MRELLMLQILLVKGEIPDDAKSALIVSVDSLIDSCILDVTCIFYIYPNRSWLDIYKVVNDTILFRDNKGFSIIGMGTF
jgi:hypothetical protein